jgi:hypothetical protein
MDPATLKPVDRPNQDEGSQVIENRARPARIERERGRVQADVADADKRTRTGSTTESVRNTPPSGDWNDTARGEAE